MTREEVYKACTRWVVEAPDDHEWNRQTVTDFVMSIIERKEAKTMPGPTPDQIITGIEALLKLFALLMQARQNGDLSLPKTQQKQMATLLGRLADRAVDLRAELLDK